MSVLLVEDEPDARELLSRALTRGGFTCTAVGSVAEALLAARPPAFFDAVVSDVRLGPDELGGVRLIGELRALDVRAPIVIITAFADVETVKRALNEGASFLLEKPFRAPDLVETVKRVLAEPRDIGFLVERALSKAELTDKEQAVAKLILKGLTSVEIATLEGNSDKTIRQHITKIYAKCGVTSRAELFHFVFPW